MFTGQILVEQTMGMSTHIVGFTDEHDKRADVLMSKRDVLAQRLTEMKAFGYKDPDTQEQIEQINFELYDLAEGTNLEGHVLEWREDFSSGFEVDLSKLPPGITRIRFYNSW
jgi:hypothetical protein